MLSAAVPKPHMIGTLFISCLLAIGGFDTPFAKCAQGYSTTRGDILLIYPRNFYFQFCVNLRLDIIDSSIHAILVFQ
ncbi:hypothetical protein ANRL2_04516 [Anaerolineae bacterium]|nr:hypothetical protein ANRL2_04516 [Anaerolineae bacterium]